MRPWRMVVSIAGRPDSTWVRSEDYEELVALAKAVFANPLDIDAMLALGEALSEEVRPIQTDP